MQYTTTAKLDTTCGPVTFRILRNDVEYARVIKTPRYEDLAPDSVVCPNYFVASVEPGDLYSIEIHNHTSQFVAVNGKSGHNVLCQDAQQEQSSGLMNFPVVVPPNDRFVMTGFRGYRNYSDGQTDLNRVKCFLASRSMKTVGKVCRQRTKGKKSKSNRSIKYKLLDSPVPLVSFDAAGPASSEVADLYSRENNRWKHLDRSVRFSAESVYCSGAIEFTVEFLKPCAELSQAELRDLVLHRARSFDESLLSFGSPLLPDRTSSSIGFTVSVAVPSPTDFPPRSDPIFTYPGPEREDPIEDRFLRSNYVEFYLPTEFATCRAREALKNSAKGAAPDEVRRNLRVACDDFKRLFEAHLISYTILGEVHKVQLRLCDASSASMRSLEYAWRGPKEMLYTWPLAVRNSAGRTTLQLPEMVKCLLMDVAVDCGLPHFYEQLKASHVVQLLAINPLFEKRALAYLSTHTLEESTDLLLRRFSYSDSQRHAFKESLGDTDWLVPPERRNTATYRSRLQIRMKGMKLALARNNLDHINPPNWRSELVSSADRVLDQLACAVSSALFGNPVFSQALVYAVSAWQARMDPQRDFRNPERDAPLRGHCTVGAHENVFDELQRLSNYLGISIVVVTGEQSWRDGLFYFKPCFGTLPFATIFLGYSCHNDPFLPLTSAQTSRDVKLCLVGFAPDSDEIVVDVSEKSLPSPKDPPSLSVLPNPCGCRCVHFLSHFPSPSTPWVDPIGELDSYLFVFSRLTPLSLQIPLVTPIFCL